MKSIWSGLFQVTLNEYLITGERLKVRISVCCSSLDGWHRQNEVDFSQAWAALQIKGQDCVACGLVAAYFILMYRRPLNVE